MAEEQTSQNEQSAERESRERSGGSSGSGGSGGGAPRRRRFGGGGGNRYFPRRKVCYFCMDGIEVVDYKDIGRLRRYVSDRGKIEPRRQTGTCAKHQRMLSRAVKRARHVALIPFSQ